MCVQFIMALKGNTLHDNKEVSPLEALTFMTLDLYRAWEMIGKMIFSHLGSNSRLWEASRQ